MASRALLVEDNPMLATILSDLLNEHHPNLEVLGVAQNGAQGLEKITHLQPDLVFLDIEMPDMTGFDMLAKLDKIEFQTIFTTAHSQYAIKAFRFNALDYLLKPIDPQELSEAIDRFYELAHSRENQERVEYLIQNTKTSKVADQYLTLATQRGHLRLQLNRIVKIEAQRNYSCLHLEDHSRALSSKNLLYFEDILAEKGFLRCHHSVLVNHSHIKKLLRSYFVLHDDSTVPISRRKQKEAEIWFGTYASESKKP